MSNVRDVLESLGYTAITELAKEYRMAPLYRESSNRTVLVVRKDSGRWIDYAAQVTGDLADLVKLSLNLATLEDATAWLANKHIHVAQSIKEPPKQSLSIPKIFDKSILLKLADDTSYWENRGISVELLRRFQGGLAFKGKLAGRYVFPIFNSRQEIVGFAGRDIFNNPDRVKWKLLGTKDQWVYPAFLNHKLIKEKREVILVESIGDCLALFNAGIEHVLVTFGIHLGAGILNFLLRADIQRITIGFNNDATEGKTWGNDAADKLKKKLLHHFDPQQVEISLPDKKDFGAMTPEEIQIWFQRERYQPVV